ncbi:MAG: peptide deformylase [Pseudomonadota bacterium]
MAERRVLRMGDPFLHQVAELVTEIGTDEFKVLIEDMWDTMAARSGIGLAAPQIGVGLRVMVFGVESSPRYEDAGAIPPTVLVNPTVTALSDERANGWEGCLSIPGMRGVVPRYEHIRYVGVDANGDAIDREASGFHARVVQHEMDHLDGILYPQRMDDLSKFGFEEEISLAGRFDTRFC